MFAKIPLGGTKPLSAHRLKVIGSDVKTSLQDKRDNFGFPIVNCPWLSDDVPRSLDSHRTVFTLISLLDLLGIALAFGYRKSF